MEGRHYTLEVSRPQCLGTQVSKPLTMDLNLKNNSTGWDRRSDSKERPPYIKPRLTHNRRPGYSSVDSSQRKSKDTSSDDSTSITTHSRINITANLNFPPAPPKKISADEDKRPDRNSPMVSNGKPADSSGLTSHMAFTNTKFEEDLPQSKQVKNAFAAESSSSQTKPKSTIRGEFTSNPNHPKSTIGDITKTNPGNPQNNSPDELILNPRNPEDLSRRSAYVSSLEVAGQSSSYSPTVNSSTAINSKNHLDQSSLSTDFHVDPAVSTYIRVFMEDEISDVLRQSNVEMKTETGEGYNRVLLTAKSPDLPQLFYKAAREISEIFSQYQRFLRVESIDLSNISADVTKKLQVYLFHCGIWSSPNKSRLQLIGPSKYLLEFMEKWTSARGDFARFIRLVQEGVPPGSPRPSGSRNGQCSPPHNSQQ